MRTIRNGTADTFQVWVEGSHIGSWTDNAPIRGPHFAIHAAASIGRIKFTDRDVFDLNTEFVARYIAGYDDGHLESDLVVRTVDGAKTPTPMHFSNLPIGFLSGHARYNSAEGYIYEGDWNRTCVAAAVPNNYCATSVLGGTKHSAGAAAFLGEQTGLNGYFVVPRLAEVNGQPASQPTIELTNGNEAIGPGVVTVQLNTIDSALELPPDPDISSTRMKADWWGRIPTLLGIKSPNEPLQEGQTATFELLMNTPLALPVTIDYSTEGISATSQVDFAQTSGSVVIPAGQQITTVDVPIYSDDQIESDESFSLVITRITNVPLLTDRGTAIIRDVTPEPNVTISDTSVRENNSPPASFTVELSVPATETVTVAFTTQDGTAAAGSDYTATSDQLIFLPGETVKQIDVFVIEDDLKELDEDFFVILSNPIGAVLSDSEGRGIIRDDDPADILISNRDFDVQEGDPGDQFEAIFQIRLTDYHYLDVEVDYTTVAGTALAEQDFIPVSGTALIPANTLTTTVPVRIIPDFEIEVDETFEFVLSNPVNSAISNSGGRAKVTILDNDAIADFDRNGALGHGDLDLLYREIAAGNNDTFFDLTGDGSVNVDDLNHWILRKQTAPGDANLDLSVDASDFNIWSENRFMAVDTWAQGDFNADGVADGSDFNIWLENRFTKQASNASGVKRNDRLMRLPRQAAKHTRNEVLAMATDTVFASKPHPTHGTWFKRSDHIL